MKNHPAITTRNVGRNGFSSITRKYCDMQNTSTHPVIRKNQRATFVLFTLRLSLLYLVFVEMFVVEPQPH
jgi:hypothetical protein